MELNKGYWLWGLFPNKENYFLNEIKDKVQSKLKSPFFETHITLAGPYLNIDKFSSKELKTFAGNNSFIILNIDGYNFKQEIYKSFYIQIKQSSHLKELRRNICELNNFDLENDYLPHVSLTYGDHSIKVKKELISKLPVLNKPIIMSRIALVEVCADINLWKILESFDLN